MMNTHDSLCRETHSRHASPVSVRPLIGWPLAAAALLLVVMGLLKLIDV